MQLYHLSCREFLPALRRKEFRSNNYDKKGKDQAFLPSSNYAHLLAVAQNQRLRRGR